MNKYFLQGVPNTNKYISGSTGELRVASEFLRNSYRIAKPFWNHDAIDLLLLEKDNDRMFSIPIQVKTVQFLPEGKKAAFPKHRKIQGLTKAHVESNMFLLLCIYSLTDDVIWVIPGKDNIIAAYEVQKTWNRRHVSYSKLALKSDVRIYAPNIFDAPNSALLSKWLLPPRNSGSSLRQTVSAIKKYITENWRESIRNESLWWQTPPAQESS